MHSKVQPDFIFLYEYYLLSLYRLYDDIEAILANLLLNRRNEDREMGYGGK